MELLPAPLPLLPETALWVLGLEKPSDPFSSRWSWSRRARCPESWRPHSCPPSAMPPETRRSNKAGFWEMYPQPQLEPLLAEWSLINIAGDS